MDNPTIKGPAAVDLIARLLDEEAWSLYDDPRMVSRPLREQIVEESRKTAVKIVNSGLMASHKWERAEYIRAKRNILNVTSRRGHCYDVQDGLDGYVMHDPRCERWPDSAIGGTGCIKP